MFLQDFMRKFSLSSINLGAWILVHLLLYILESLWHKYCPAFTRPVVRVREGKLRGLTLKLPSGSPYHLFKGIPYAKPPIGELRFRPPVAIGKFDEPILDCSVHRNVCVQLMFPANIVIGSEDGLFLNVYTPMLPESISDGVRLPVMIYIHGGGFQDGSGSSFLYNPLSLLEEKVVVVTLNYRLGPLGFQCLPSAGIYGNMGLKDQRLAFRWVQKNIVQFGGDPQNVTIFGESAGSVAVQIHYQSESSRKYFHRIIGQGLSGFTEPFFQTDPSAKARKLAWLLGGAGSSDQDCYGLIHLPIIFFVNFTRDLNVAICDKDGLLRNNRIWDFLSKCNSYKQIRRAKKAEDLASFRPDMQQLAGDNMNKLLSIC